MPGALGCTVADAVRGDANTPAAVNAPPTASLTNSLRSGAKPLFAISDAFWSFSFCPISPILEEVTSLAYYYA
jgi:hypothetical protein